MPHPCPRLPGAYVCDILGVPVSSEGFFVREVKTWNSFTAGKVGESYSDGKYLELNII